ncbi:YjdF family protein [Priestia filamentosa]|uniref:YjdF family protein n=1 Tax=Priestia filamentosa TaxID=1402861 RepID=UPI001FB4D3A2|nr:YjdF family protein [Priestia filamentosa]MED3727442.1 YjdF family protein [Priestia filamentosa]UOE58445.1 YjdF family protein [Priestia filamentosa]
MRLTIYHDGQFWVGTIEVVSDGHLKAFRHVFGGEPKDSEVLTFIYHELSTLIHNSHQSGVNVKQNDLKRINPKRLQRRVAKEMRRTGVSTKAQEAVRQEYEERKKQRKHITKQHREEEKQRKYHLKKKKAKAKHKGR